MNPLLTEKNSKLLRKTLEYVGYVQKIRVLYTLFWYFGFIKCPQKLFVKFFDISFSCRSEDFISALAFNPDYATEKGLIHSKLSDLVDIDDEMIDMPVIRSSAELNDR